MSVAPLIKVVFGSSSKRYSYKICDFLYTRLALGDKIQIRNEAGWNYRNEVVEVVEMQRYPNSASDDCYDLKEIVAFKPKNSNIWFKREDSSAPSVKEIVSNHFSNLAKDNNLNKGDIFMNRIFGDVEFGKYTGDQLRLSIKGIAYLNDGGDNWVVWDNNTGTFVNVNEFVFDKNDTSNMIYLMPVAIKNIAIGDIILHNGDYVIVKEKSVDNRLITVINPRSNELRTIMPVRNIFGFDFYTKAVSLIDSGVFGVATAENPFGDMLPFFLMNKSGNTDMKDFMLMSMLCGGDTKNFMNNPLMMYMLMGDKGGKDNFLPYMMMMGNGFNNPFAPAALKVSGETYAKVSGETYAKEVSDDICDCDRTCKH